MPFDLTALRVHMGSHGRWLWRLGESILYMLRSAVLTLLFWGLASGHVLSLLRLIHSALIYCIAAP